MTPDLYHFYVCHVDFKLIRYSNCVYACFVVVVVVVEFGWVMVWWILINFQFFQCS